MPGIDRGMVRIFKSARDEVYREWSRPGFEKLGTRLQRALLAERILFIAAMQAPIVGDEAVRRIVEDGRVWVVEQTEDVD